MQIAFTKMHGLGNDFVVIDTRANNNNPLLTPATVRQLGDRHTGVGFDQLLLIDDATDDAHAAYRIFNADGDAVGQCGNGARCIAAYLQARDGYAEGDHLTLASPSGPVHAVLADQGEVMVAMAIPSLQPADIPLARDAAQPLHTFDVAGQVVAGCALSVGNPHCVIFVDDVDSAPVATVAPALQSSADFPEGVNVGFAEITGRDALRLRVVERGVGETRACGTGACAAAVAAIVNGHTERTVKVTLPGGTLVLDWPAPEERVQMTGPTAVAFEGHIQL
ncbi:MAG: diaminopimelate epimerase [Pseudomonadota bacterium]